MGNRLVAYLVLGTTLVQVSGSVIRAGGEVQTAGAVPMSIAGAFQPPPEFEGDLGPYKSPLATTQGPVDPHQGCGMGLPPLQGLPRLGLIVSKLVHRFAAESDDASIFDAHVIGLNAGNDKVSGRASIDPSGEKVAGGLVRAPRITHAEASQQLG